MEILTQSARETQKLGEKFATDLVSDKLSSRVICLYGELGSGKTTFIQGLARGLGIKKRVLSPTFIMMREYRISPPRSPFGHLGGGEAATSTPARCNVFYHVDLYRAENEKDVEGLGLSEIWSDPENIVAIEWPEKIEKILPKNRIDVCFEYVSDTERKISVNSVKVRPCSRTDLG